MSDLAALHVDQPVDIKRPIRLKPPPPPRVGELQLTDDFWPLLTQRGRYKVYYGGRGAGKSLSIAKALIWLAARVKIRVLCTREIQHTLKESVHASLRSCIDEMGYAELFVITNEGIKSKVGAEFIFMGLRSHSAEIKSLHAIDIVWVEEAHAVSEDSWDNLTKTIRKIKAEDADPQIWVSFNPYEEKSDKGVKNHTYALFVTGKESIERNYPGSYVKLVNWDRNPWFVNCGLETERQADIDRIDKCVDEAGKMEAYLRVLHIWEGRIRKLPGGNYFSLNSMLVAGKPAATPWHPTFVMVIIDTANKTGLANDGCAAVYVAVDLNNVCEYPLYILDWEYKQIDGAMLETWLPTVFENLEFYAKETQALQGSKGARIEDQQSGTVLLQQAAMHGWDAYPISHKLTALNKHAKCLNVSSYVHLGQVKITQRAFDKRVTYKGETKNHLLDQVLSFSASVKEKSDVADDLRDAWAYSIAITLGPEFE